MALEILHSENIIHRDIKPDNLMIDKQGLIKLIDFGFSKKLDNNQNLRTLTKCGTMGYTAPEILSDSKEGYGIKADIWSFGITICEIYS